MKTKIRTETGLSDRKIIQEIQYLCSCGAGLEAIAGPVSRAARRLIGADQGSLFWLDEHRNPVGFFHETDRADLKDLFITRFDDLFSGPGQASMLTWTEPGEPSIGRVLDPGRIAAFWQSNVYKMLCVPLGHRFALDLRVDVDGIGRAVMVLWNPPDRPFTVRDAEKLRPVQAALHDAIVSQRPDARWVQQCSGSAHFMTDMSGQQLVAIDSEAETLLMTSHLLAQNVPMTSKPRTAPAFAIILSAMLAAGAPARHTIPIANGRIVATARPTQMLDGEGGEATRMFVSLRHEMSFDVLGIRHLMTLPLSPLQREIALFGMQGQDRNSCFSRFGVSPEALKKHCACIFAAIAIPNWAALAAYGDAISRLS